MIAYNATQEDRRILLHLLGQGKDLPGPLALDESLRSLHKHKLVQWDSTSKAWRLTPNGRQFAHSLT